MAEGGILAMHDTIRKRGPKRVLWEEVFRSGRFQEIAIVDNITAVRKVSHAALGARLKNYSALTLRALYIAARKSGLAHSKTVGRRLLKTWTRQEWLPGAPLIFLHALILCA